MSVSLKRLRWPLLRAGEALAELARRSGLTSGAPEVPPLTHGLDLHDEAAQAHWIEWAAERLGVEAEAVATPLGTLPELLASAAPALLWLPGSEGSSGSFLLLHQARKGQVQLIGPDLSLQQLTLDELAAALCQPVQAPYLAAMDRLLDVAQVPDAKRESTRQAMLHEHLASEQVGRCWLLRAAPGQGFWLQLRQARLPGKVGWMLGVFGVLYGAEIASWSMVGQITLNGRLDLGWLAAWALLVLSLVPLHLLGGWLDASFALEMGRMLKTRLLTGILQSDLDTVRTQGAGQLLSRVMESQALESLAVNGGMGVLVATLELGIAAVVLAGGAGGLGHVLVLLGWLLLSLALSWRYFRRLRHWVLLRLDLTHGLVERMVGHRTRLAQERPWRRDLQEDLAMQDYLAASQAMDRSIVPAAILLPRGWMLVGLAGLLPAFVAGNASPASLGVALGGMMLANRALTGISAGLAAISRAAVSWQQVGSLFATRGVAAGKMPYLGPGTNIPSEDPSVRGPVIDASQLCFGYGPNGEMVLNGLNLRIESGERILLEGPSGGGKSTLASLLVGLRKPQSGLLLLNGLDRHTLGEAWQQLATEAPQFHENHILSGPLAFNLLMGRNWPATPAEMQEATDLCVELGLGPLLERMPSGLMQMVGETGWQLSHGERSRIFLARALLQKADLTVLDESFAALDPETLEQCLHCALQRSKALLVIAHP